MMINNSVNYPNHGGHYSVFKDLKLLRRLGMKYFLEFRKGSLQNL